MARTLEWRCASCGQRSEKDVVFRSYADAAEHLVDVHGSLVVDVFVGMFITAAPKTADELWQKLTAVLEEG